MSLFKYEVKKLFWNGKSFIIICIYFLLIFGGYLLDELEYKNEYGNEDSLLNIYKPFEGKYSEEFYQESKEQFQYFINLKITEPETMNNIEYRRKKRVYIDYINFGQSFNNYSTGNQLNIGSVENSIEEMKLELLKLETEEEIDSFEYKETAKRLDILIKRGESEFAYYKSWKKIMESSISGPYDLFFLIILLIILSPAFSSDTSLGIEQILLSTKHGRKKIVTIKLKAAVLFSTLFIIICKLMQIIPILVVNGVKGFDVQIYNNPLLMFTPFNLNMLEFVIFGVIIQVIIGALISCLVLLVSSRTKKPFISIIVSFCVIFYATIIQTVFQENSYIFQGIIDWNLYELFNMKQLISSTKIYNFFGNCITMIEILPFFIIGFGVLLVCLLYYSVREKEIL